jgi:hypothetical protein
MSNGDWKPTARLRWEERRQGDAIPYRVLQVWWAPDVPAYMVDPVVGEWRDVECVVGAM